jgi:hypothetical protein
MRIALWVIVVANSLLLSSCKTPAQPFTEQRYVVASKETVKISALDLSITNNGCGRKWISEGDQPSFERAYCDVVIKRGNKTVNAGSDRDTVYIGDVSIKIERMNPWGAVEDSIPPGGCRIWVCKTGSR